MNIIPIQNVFLHKFLLMKFILLTMQSTSTISAGFPSPAQEYSEKKLDLNELLIHKPAATFFVKAEGHSMCREGIMHQDLLIVDRSLKAKNGHIVIATIDGQLNICKLIKVDQRYYLKSKNQNLDITENDNVTIWGVVKHAIHHFRV